MLQRNELHPSGRGRRLQTHFWREDAFYPVPGCRSVHALCELDHDHRNRERVAGPCCLVLRYWLEGLQRLSLAAVAQLRLMLLRPRGSFFRQIRLLIADLRSAREAISFLWFLYRRQIALPRLQ